MIHNALASFRNTISETTKLQEIPTALLLEPIDEGKWSIREIIGHLYYWDKFNLEHMVPYMRNGAHLPAFPDHDQHNEEAIRYIEKFDTVSSIINQFITTRELLIEQLSGIEIDARFTIEREPSTFSTQLFVDIFAEHDLHHLQQIAVKLQAAKSKPLHAISWIEKSSSLDEILENGNSYTTSPMDSGLEAEVIQINLHDSSMVLKVWNKQSKPDIYKQYHLLDELSKQGLSVSQPLGWGEDTDRNPVMLTSFDGHPIAKLNAAILTELAVMLMDIHRLPLEVLDASTVQKYDFKPYFFPFIEQYEDLQALLIPLLEASTITQGSIIHGDYNLGNIVEGAQGYTIIDWTNGQLGDPRFDIAWSIFLIKIYVGPRYGKIYHHAFTERLSYTLEELERFEAIACLRWLMLYRTFDDLPMNKQTLPRVKSFLKNSIYLSESLLSSKSSPAQPHT